MPLPVLISAAMPLPQACQHGSLGVLSVLDEGTLVEVLRAAKTTKVLARLASTSRQLCTSARTGVPLTLHVTSPEHAQLVLRSHARGRPPFSGCTMLVLGPYTTADCLLAAGVLGVAQHWRELQEVCLLVDVLPQDLPDGHSLGMCVCAMLGTLPALQQLRRLDLTIPDAGPCSGECIGRLVQLTHLSLRGSRDDSEADTQLDMRSWSRLTNLQELYMESVSGAQPAAGAAGPFCLPSSLTAVTWWYHQDPKDLACLVTHLPGCPQLQELDIRYGDLDEVCAHPAAVVRLLGQHNTQLRQLVFEHSGGASENWGTSVPPLPGYAEREEGEWRPDAALSALTGLQELNAADLLTLRAWGDWQHLAQLRALTKLCGAEFCYTPQLPAGATLVVLKLEECWVHLGGRGVGCLLLACPQLETAELFITAPLVPTPVGSPEAQLQPHPRLRTLQLRRCNGWSSAAADASAAPPPQPAAAAAAGAATTSVPHAAAAAHFAELAPVLAGVSELKLGNWLAGNSSNNSSSNSSSSTRGILPDLSRCTALTKLVFDSYTYGRQDLAPLEQEEYLSMVAPLTQLKCLQLEHAARVNARVALVLQAMLPQLLRVELSYCGGQLPLMPEGSEQQQKQAALDRVKQLMRPGLVLHVSGW